jgi:U4/U6.U5 tri-snRNP-associated protein 2
LSGIVGLNNIKANDYCNVVLQVCKGPMVTLSRHALEQATSNKPKRPTSKKIFFKSLVNAPMLRDYFLREENYLKIKVIPGDIMINLVKRFGELTRKLWNPRNFKAHVSPHEMLQAVVKCSKKKFQITSQGELIEF